MTTVSTGAERGRAHVGADECRCASPSAARARSTSRAQQLDAGDANVDRRVGPAARPAALARRSARPRQQAGEQALAAADVEDPARAARSGRARAGGRNRVASAACRARSARRSGRRAVGTRSPPSTSARHATAASAALSRCASRGRRRRCVGAGSPRARRRQRHRHAGRGRASAASSAGSTSSSTARPSSAARGVAVVQQQDVAGARGRASRRARTRRGSRRTVSKPRRVQLTSWRSRRCSTGARNGLRSPAGARKKRGSSPVMSASDACAARDLARHAPRGPSSEKRCEWRRLWFCTLWPRRDDLAAQRRVGARALGDAEEGRAARRARRAGRERPA